MNIKNFVVGAFCGGLLLTGCNNGQSIESVSLKSDLDSASYAIGVNMGQGLKKNLASFPGDTVNYDALLGALVDVFHEKDLQISQEMTNGVISSYISQIQEKVSARNKEEGDQFLADNKGKDGVQVTASGLQYEVLKEGNGEKPSAEDRVECHYHGTLIDGTVFDSSVDRGQPATFAVKGVIKAWQEALPLMTVGSKWKLVVPSDLAYGDRGAGGKIGPNQTLIFEVELLKIVK